MDLTKTGFIPQGDCRWMRAHVVVHVDDLEQDLHDVTLHAWVEGRDAAGAPSRLAEQVLHGVHVERAHPDLALDLAYPEVGGAGGSTIRVHLDLHGDGEVHSGDYLNPVACPVPTAFHDRTRRLNLQRVP